MIGVDALCDRHAYPDALRALLHAIVELCVAEIPGLEGLVLSGSTATGDFVWRQADDGLRGNPGHHFADPRVAHQPPLDPVRRLGLQHPHPLKLKLLAVRRVDDPSTGRDRGGARRQRRVREALHAARSPLRGHDFADL